MHHAPRELYHTVLISQRDVLAADRRGVDRTHAMLLWLLPPAVSGCTTYAAGKRATADGSVLVTHSDDGMGATDPRVSYVPAADHPKGSKRPIWPDIETYPRYVGTARGKTYARQPGQEDTQPIGSIPQVEHTHAYLESNYALQNECQLSFGESTASAVFRADALGTPGGTALLSVNELSKIAAERTCRAREAVLLMGTLAEAHGFYGPDGGAGEVLTVGDTDEAWVFHILSEPTGKSALWAAQRVPDDEVAVVANMFSIRALNLSDSANFLGSAQLHATARAYRLWDGHGLLDFTRAFSIGEYGSKYYSGRRMWDGLRRFAPSLAPHLAAEYGNLKDDYGDVSTPWRTSVYPFSVPPDAPLRLDHIFAAHRSHYEGCATRRRQHSAACATRALRSAASHRRAPTPGGARLPNMAARRTTRRRASPPGRSVVPTATRRPTCPATRASARGSAPSPSTARRARGWCRGWQRSSRRPASRRLSAAPRAPAGDGCSVEAARRVRPHAVCRAGGDGGREAARRRRRHRVVRARRLEQDRLLPAAGGGGRAAGAVCPRLPRPPRAQGRVLGASVRAESRAGARSTLVVAGPPPRAPRPTTSVHLHWRPCPRPRRGRSTTER